MTDSRKILEILKTDSPFSSNAAGDPREQRFPDVPGLGDDVFEAIRSLIAIKKKRHAMQCAAAVVGEAGSGKTHLIARLIDCRRAGPVQYNFAYIYPFIDPNRSFRYLLREIMANLAGRFKKDKFSQLDELAAGMGCAVLSELSGKFSMRGLLDQCRLLKKNPVRILEIPIGPVKDVKLAIQFGVRTFLEKNPALHREFLRVMLNYCFFPQTRPAATQWLMGRTLPAREAEKLGVNDRGTDRIETIEDEAQQILFSLDMLHLLRGRPMPVLFDQLENLTGKEQIQAFQKIVFLLGDRCKAMFPIAFFRGQDWEMKFSEGMDDFCRSRFKANLFDLKGCDRQQALELIRSRLKFVLDGESTPNDLYPFHPEHERELARMLAQQEMHPRQVINRANRLLSKILHGRMPEKRSDTEILKQAYQARYDEILASQEQYPPDESRITLALSLYLSNRPQSAPYHVDNLDTAPKEERFIDISAKVSVKGQDPHPLIILVDMEHHHQSVLASLRRAIAFLEANPRAKAIYIRDGRCPFPSPEKWVKNNQAREQFEKLGGFFLLSPIQEISRLYALAFLKFDIQAGDITSDSGKPLDEQNLNQFIQSEIHPTTYRIFFHIDSYLTSENPDRQIRF